MTNATPELRLYAILLSQPNIAWLDRWLKAGVTSEPEQAEISKTIEEKLATIARIWKDAPATST